MEPKEQQQQNDRFTERVERALEENWQEGDSKHTGYDVYGTPCIWDEHRADIYRERASGK